MGPTSSSLYQSPSSESIVRSYLHRPSPSARPPAKLPGASSDCSACRSSILEGRLLVCDGCELGFHVDCAQMQGRKMTAADEWLCGDCVRNAVTSNRWCLGAIKNKRGGGGGGRSKALDRMFCLAASNKVRTCDFRENMLAEMGALDNNIHLAEMGALDSNILFKVLIHKEEKRVVFAEANSDFIDILFSFLTLPMGTILRLILLGKNAETSQAMALGSFNTLYRSMVNLEDRYFTTKECKDVLLHTRNSAEAVCQKLKININSLKPYYVCENLCFSQDSKYASFSTSATAKCQKCGRFLNVPFYYSASTHEEDQGVFATDNGSFLISEDLHVVPSNPSLALVILESSGITDLGVLEEKIFKLRFREVIDLLEKALFSKTPLTDTVFGNKCNNPIVLTPQSGNSTESVDGFKKMTVNVLVQKSNNRILVAHTSGDFIDFLFSFLTAPLGSVLSVLSKDDGPTFCVKNIHQSVSELSVGEHLISQQMKDTLLNPRSHILYLSPNLLFPLKEETIPTFYWDMKAMSHGHKVYCLTTTASSSSVGRGMKLERPKSEGGFLKVSTKYMVTDDLVVTPLSSMSCITYLRSCKVLLNDIEEQVIEIGMGEAFNLLRAALTSTSVLTNGLKHLLRNKTTAERPLKRPKVEI